MEETCDQKIRKMQREAMHQAIMAQVAAQMARGDSVDCSEFYIGDSSNHDEGLEDDGDSDTDVDDVDHSVRLERMFGQPPDDCGDDSSTPVSKGPCEKQAHSPTPDPAAPPMPLAGTD